MNTREIEEQLYNAAKYADAIVAIADAHDDDPSFKMLADKCSTDIIAAIEKLQELHEGRKGAEGE